MEYQIDVEAGTIRCPATGQEEQVVDFYSMAGLRLLSALWVKQEWQLLHWQSFSWLGFQIWQLPEDLLRLQEVVFRIAPDVIIETGVQRGGSTVFFASLCRLLGKGRVVSIDIRIDAEVRQALDACPFADLITLIEGDAVAPGIVARVKAEVSPTDKVLVFLDSNHTKAHVLAELHAYGDLVTPGSYAVATDGVMQFLAATPMGRREWEWDNPAAAAREYAASRPDFVIERPTALYRDDRVIQELTYWPDAWLLRLPADTPDATRRDETH